MEGLSRWDLVLWVFVAYGALVALARLWFRYRTKFARRLHSRLPAPAQPNAATADERRDAA